MKGVCIVFQRKINVQDSGVTAILDAFCLGGYAFDEVRYLSFSEMENLSSILEGGKGEPRLLALLASKADLPLLAGSVNALGLQPCTQYQNAGIYADKQNPVFLLSADGGETGAAFVKNSCVPFMQQNSGVRYDKFVIRSIGASEARVQSLLSEAGRYGGSKIRYSHLRKYDEDVIEAVYDESASKILIDDTLRLFANGLGDTMYALNDVSIEEQLITLLKVRNKKISVAESFTGGGIARRITSVSGASEVYFEGLNTYNEYAKIKRLGVSEYTLKTVGAVSDQTAYEMAYGLLNTGDCDISVATTGIAGPKSDRSMQPVGLCYIAVGTRERIRVYRYIFDGDRKEITEKAIDYALYHGYGAVKDL